MRAQDGAEAEVLFEYLAEFDGEAAAELVDHGDHEVVASREMDEHVAVRHADRLGDIGGGGIGDPVAREQGHRGVDEASAGRDLLFVSGCRLHRWPSK